MFACLEGRPRQAIVKTFHRILLLAILAVLAASAPRVRALPSAGSNPDPNSLDSTDAVRQAQRMATPDELVHRLKNPILYSHGQGVDPRRDDVSFDPDSGIVELRSMLDNSELGYNVRMPLRGYTRYLTLKNFDEMLVRKSYLELGAVRDATSGIRAGSFKFELPVSVPTGLQSIFGKQRPNLTLSGSETLTLGGTSSFNNQPTSFGRQSKFPQLEMKQDLQVRVAGSIGEKVKVDVDQTSNAAATPLSNRIHISYAGDEDEVVRSFELGNTNLALPGTQFVSYSGQHQGLFGLKTISKFGPMDLTLIASKQEGQSKRDTFRRSSQAHTDRLEDYQYVQRTYFYLSLDPAEQIDLGSLRVYLDNRSTSGDVTQKVHGFGYLDPTAIDPDPRRAYEGHFIDEPEGVFYRKVTNNRGDRRTYIELTSQLDEGSVLAVSYSRLDGTRVGGSSQGELAVKILRVHKELLGIDKNGALLAPEESNGYWNTCVPYELRNIYRLSGTSIDPEKFKLHIFTTASNPPQDYLGSDKLIEITGLDNEVINGSQYAFGPNGKGDDRIDGDDGAGRAFIDYTRGLVFFPDARPFYYQPDPGRHNTSQDTRQRPSLFTQENCDSAVYVLRDYNPNSALQLGGASKYYLEATYRESQGEDIIRLGQTDILPGSEVVTINGQRLTRDVDYRITPEIGEIQILSRNLLLGNPDIQIDYAYASLFSTSSKALVGFSAAYGAGTDKSMATTWLFENTSAQDLRPRLGEEPSRTIVGDVNAQGRWQPKVLTSLVNALPLVNTTAESNVAAQGELALSLPNPNTKGLVYVDDFEAVKDITSIDLSFGSWRWSSVPDSTRHDPDHSLPILASNARTHWYNTLSRVREGDLKPQLTGSEATTQRRTLELRVERDPFDQSGAPLWAGIQQGLSRVPLDLSTATDMELWVNEHPELQVSGPVAPQQWPDDARLHIDFGLVSEDEQWQPNTPPDGRLNSENALGSGQFSALVDDNGLDTIPDVRELGRYDPYYPGDPNGDNFKDVILPSNANEEYKDSSYWIKYQGENGTEHNRRFDSEDLDGNNQLDTQTQYYEYSIPLNQLGNSQYKVEDGAQGLGWKFLRVPIAAFVSSSQFQPGGGPASWRNVKHVRIWVSGGTAGNRVSLAELSMVGNRWQKNAAIITDSILGPRLRVSTVNNKDNLEYTTPPGVDPGVTQSGAGNVTNRESSLTLETGNLRPKDRVSAFRLFQRQTADYTLYRSVDLFLKGLRVYGENLRFFIRLGDIDTTSYYEYSTPVKQGEWRAIHLDFASLTNLKLNYIGSKDTILSVALPGDSTGGPDSVRVRKKPSFNSLKRIEVGLYNVGGESGVTDSAVVWVDELTLGNVRRDMGTAQRASVDMSLADFGQIGVQYQRSGADFLNIGRTVGAGSTITNLAVNMSFRLSKFMEPLGVQFPVSISLSKSSSVPKFLTGSDLQLEAANVKSQTTESRGLTLTSSLSRTSTDSPWYLRYFVDPFTLSASYSKAKSTGPTADDTTRDVNAQLQYALAPRGERTHIDVPLLGKFYPLPTGLNVSQNRNENLSDHTDKSLTDTTVVVRPTSRRLASAMSVSTGLRPLDNLTYSLTKVHDLQLHRRLGPLNVGEEVQRTHALTFTQELKVKGLGPRLDYSATSSDQKPLDLSRDLLIHNYNNSSTVTLIMELPFARLKPAPRGAQDSSGVNPLRIFGSLLGAVGNVSGNYTVTRSNATSRSLQGGNSLLGDMPLGYLLGFQSDTSFGLIQKGGNKAYTISKHGTAQNQIRLGQVSVDIHYDLTRSKGYGTNGSSGQRSLTWPDVRVTWGALEKFLPLGGFATGVNATTNYSLVERLQFSNLETPDQRVLTKSWQPLLTFSGELKNHDHFTFTTDYSLSTSENSRGNGSTQNSNQTFKLNLRHTIKGPEGVPDAGAGDLGFRLRGNIDVNLDGSYQIQRAQTLLLTGPQQAEQVNKRLDISATAGYGFANNVHGSLVSGYTRTNNSQQQLVTQSIRLQATASLNF